MEAESCDRSICNTRFLLIVGIARGGTTFTQEVFNSHEEIALSSDAFLPIFRLARDIALRESKDFIRLGGSDAAIYDGYSDPAMPQLLRRVRDLDFEKLWLPDGVRESFRTVLERRMSLGASTLIPEMRRNFGGGSCADFLRAALRAVRTGMDAEQARWVGFKELWIVDFIPPLLRLFPKMQVVVVVRDPRAVLASSLRMGERDESTRSDPISVLRQWRKIVSYARWFEVEGFGDQIHYLKYEELVQFPERVLSPIELILEVKGIWSVAKDKQLAGNSSFEGGETGADLRAVDRWRRQLALEMGVLVSLMCGPEMRALGYEFTERKLLPIGELISYYDRWVRGKSFAWIGRGDDLGREFGYEYLRESIARESTPQFSATMRDRFFPFSEAFSSRNGSAGLSI